MTDLEPHSAQSPVVNKPRGARRRFTPVQVTVIVLLTIVLTLGLSYWAITAYLFPDPFTPVILDEREQRRLDAKLQALGARPHMSGESPDRSVLEPEPYAESGARREVQFSEKELNALLAHNTDLARKLAIDLSDDLASARLLVPLDADMPLFGGKTLKVTAGLELAMAGDRPRAVLKGVSVWGVPLPNAWLGNLKNIDLVAEFGDAGGFWQTMSEGVEAVEVRQGRLRIKLKE